MADTIRVLICDPQGILREGVKTVIEREPDMEVAGEAADGEEAVRLAEDLRPDVVLLDVRMPALQGFDAARRIRKRAPSARVVIFTALEDEESVARCLRAGACGYVLKDAPPAQLAYAIREVHRGERYVSPRALRGIVDQYAKRSSKPVARYELLTEREREILILLAGGASLKEVATQLKLSVKTVDVHKYNLMRKLDLHDRTALIRYAIRRRLIEP